MADRIPKPKDGVDGIGFEDFNCEYDGHRTFTLVAAAGSREKRFQFKLPVLIDRGVFKQDVQYERGDGTTFGGSFWIAQCDTTQKPGEGNSDWRLAVKRGRDGRDGQLQAAPSKKTVRLSDARG